LSSFAPSDELRLRFPSSSIAPDAIVRYEEFKSEDHTKMGYTCGFCISGTVTTIDVLACIGEGGAPIVRLVINHPQIPATYSSIDLPVGQQDVPTPLIVPLPMGVFGLIIDTQVFLLSDEELQELSEAKLKESKPSSAQAVSRVAASVSSAASSTASTIKNMSVSSLSDTTSWITHTAASTLHHAKEVADESKQGLLKKKDDLQKHMHDTIDHSKEEVKKHLTAEEVKKGVLSGAQAVKSSVTEVSEGISNLLKKGEEGEEHLHSWRDIKHVRVVLALKGGLSDNGGYITFCLPDPPIFLLERVIEVNEMDHAQQIAKELPSLIRDGKKINL
jgi:hypothetical protein